ncbi:MAG: DUF805 domain-containing protein [Veillonella nakazawae]|uniref:DUF805 domain-containing protein n=1 Tax=Veillonella nakazawae TaxID=2682456 RepID=UPI0039965FEC
MKFCTNCGAPLQSDMAFCNNCGSPVKTSPTPTPTPTPQSLPNSTVPNYDLDPFELSEFDTLKFVFRKKYAEFNGRASRSEYFRFSLMIALCITIILSVFGIIGLATNGLASTIILYIVLGIINLILLLPNLAITVRRLHDINKSGWYFFINFIPFIGPIWFIILMLTKGNLDTNNYGPRTSYIQITPDIQQKYGVSPSPTSKSTLLYIILYIVLLGLGTGLNAAAITTSFSSFNTTTHQSDSEFVSKELEQQTKPKTLPEPTTTEATNSQPIIQNNSVEESTKALQNYYRYLTNKDFANAYSFLSNEQRANLGTYDQWRNGYSTTLSTTLLSANAISSTPDTVIYAYQLESKDLINGRIKHQTFAGNVTMIKVNNNWIIQTQDGQLVGSYFE